MDSAASYEDRRGQTKFLGVVFGYLCIGLAITALVAFLFSYIYAKAYYVADAEYHFSDSALVTLLVICGVSLVVMLIDSIVLNVSLSKSRKGAWIPYIIYCVCMGIWPGALLVFGVSPGMMGQAFGITSIVFVSMFLIGYFSKRDLSFMGLLAWGLLIGYCAIGFIYGFWYLISPGTFYIFDLVASFIVVTFSMLMVGFESNRMRKTLDYGTATMNLALYYAYQFYSDFISIFLRMLYILMLTKRDN